MTRPRDSSNDEATVIGGTGGQTFASTLSAGSVLAGRYEIGSELGKGGMGVVYKARDRVLGETVAIKILRADLSETTDAAQRFLSEIRLARAVNHRNVCRIHEYGEADGVRFMSMAFVDGQDLRQVLRKRGGLSPEEAFNVAIQAVEGLGAIHEEGIVHRDLKTANLMLDRRGVVRLMDFGIAKQWGDEAARGMTAAGQVMGTPEYMSPEQVRGATLDARSDLYAMGIVIYELFTGATPFRADTPLGTLMMHLQEPPPLDGPAAARIPAAVIPVLARTLAKAPDERFSSARELSDALRAAQAASVAAPLEATARDRHTLPTTPAPTLEPTVPGATWRAATTSPASTTSAAAGARRWVLGAVAAAGLLLFVAVVVGVVVVNRLGSTTPAPTPEAVAAPSTREPAVQVETTTPAPPVATTGPKPATATPPDRVADNRAAGPPAVHGAEVGPGAVPAPASPRRQPVANPQLVGLLEEAESAFAIQEYEMALGFYAEALRLDPRNERARIGRDLCRKALARAESATTAKPTGKTFVSGKTTSDSARRASRAPSGFDMDSGVAVERVEQARVLAGKIVTEVEPATVRPGDSFTVRVYLVNESYSPIGIDQLRVATRVNGRLAQGPVTPLASMVPARQRSLLLSLRDLWRAEVTSWSMTVSVKTSAGETLSNDLTWK